MENLQKTESMIGLGNTVGLVAICIYYYKQVGELEKKIQDLEEKIVSIVDNTDKQQSYDGDIKNINAKINKMSEIFKRQNEVIDKLAKTISVQNSKINELSNDKQPSNKNIHSNQKNTKNKRISYSNDIDSIIDEDIPKSSTKNLINFSSPKKIDNHSLNYEEDGYNQGVNFDDDELDVDTALAFISRQNEKSKNTR